MKTSGKIEFRIGDQWDLRFPFANFIHSSGAYEMGVIQYWKWNFIPGDKESINFDYQIKKSEIFSTVEISLNFSFTALR